MCLIQIKVLQSLALYNASGNRASGASDVLLPVRITSNLTKFCAQILCENFRSSPIVSNVSGMCLKRFLFFNNYQLHQTGVGKKLNISNI